MLGVGSYLVGVAHLVLVAGFATLGAHALRSRLVPMLSGAPAHLATVVLALALLISSAELLGTFGLFEPLPYLLLIAAGGLSLAALARQPTGASPAGGAGRGDHPRVLSHERDGGPRPATGPAGRSVWAAVCLIVAGVAFVHFALEAKVRLGTGMTGFDSTWYHAPFAAGFFQSGNTWDLHFIAPQFLAWFYPANSELFHAIGMQAFDRDLLSPLLNLGWFAGCLLALWCVGRPFGVAPFSLALGAIALSVPALADQAGEARNDIVGIFFLLAAVAIALNAQASGWGGGDNAPPPRHPGAPDVPGVRDPYGPLTPGASPVHGVFVVVGLAAGLAVGTKLNFLLPAAVLVVGLPLLVPRDARGRALLTTLAAALAGGGYWYLRNLAHSGNLLPWVDGIGSISLPAPDQALGGREGHSVFEYLTDGTVWSDWLLPGFADGLTVLWPLLLALSLAGLVLSLGRDPGRDGAPAAGARPALRIAGLVGVAAAVAWLIAPTSASGPDGMPRGFESGLRYLAPALVLGLSLLPVALPRRLREAGRGYSPNGRILKAPSQLARRLSGRGISPAWFVGLVVAAAVAIGYPVQRHYLENRYADPAFTTPGLNAAFGWARDISGVRIATTSTRQFPLFGLDLSNRVDYVGTERPHGGFVTPSSCRTWLRLLAEGDYDYVVASRDRVEPGKPPYPPSATWTARTGAEVVLREPPTVVFELTSPLDPSACR